jgi:lysophospholipase L1-like esterase
VTDIGQTARVQIQEVMKQFYKEGDHKTAPLDEVASSSCVIENDSKIRMIDDHDHLHYDVDRDEQIIAMNSQSVGSSLVSADQIHPNDEGYDLWGRHIAAAIIQNWDQGRMHQDTST